MSPEAELLFLLSNNVHLDMSTGGRLQPVLMRPTPQLSVKTRGGGGGGSSRGSGGGVKPGVGGGGSSRGSGGGQAGGRGGGVGQGSGGSPAKGEGRGVRVRVKVTELVEPVLVL